MPSHGQTPEGLVKAQIRNILRLLKVQHFVHFSGALSHPGVPDIIGSIPPNGRALFLEVKAPGKKPNPSQVSFLAEYASTGAIAFFADNPQTVIDTLAAYNYEPAKRIKEMFPKRP